MIPLRSLRLPASVGPPVQAAGGRWQSVRSECAAWHSLSPLPLPLCLSPSPPRAPRCLSGGGSLVRPSLPPCLPLLLRPGRGSGAAACPAQPSRRLRIPLAPRALPAPPRARSAPRWRRDRRRNRRRSPTSCEPSPLQDAAPVPDSAGAFLHLALPGQHHRAVVVSSSGGSAPSPGKGLSQGEEATGASGGLVCSPSHPVALGGGQGALEPDQRSLGGTGARVRVWGVSWMPG